MEGQAEQKQIEQESAIPSAIFINNVDDFLKEKNETVDSVLKNLQDNYTNYKWIEMKYVQSRDSLRNKVPDITKTLEMVKHLSESAEGEEEGGSVVTHFEMNGGIYGSSKLTNVKSVCLWLGANVMVEYSFSEAIALLERNLNAARTNLKSIEAELNYLKDQITTTEVNIARVYNFDVKRRKLSGEVMAPAQ
eukprot:TRINITY_DN10264_c0_g1_i1.p1 TRINITY_DN10264_c0_g1~~TRINITY_DN10264_c0_g1_i1.p1  ORF type:complete len:192 (+),score=50.87 TRINITY_DN10264_c0_g1_i1:16-591(+)